MSSAKSFFLSVWFYKCGENKLMYVFVELFLRLYFSFIDEGVALARGED